MLLRLLLNAIQYRLSLREQKALSGSLFGRAGDWLGMGAQCTKTRTRWEGRHAPGCADHPWVKCWGYDWPPKCFSTQGLSVLPPLWAHTGPCKLSGLSTGSPVKGSAAAQHGALFTNKACSGSTTHTGRPFIPFQYA